MTFRSRMAGALALAALLCSSGAQAGDDLASVKSVAIVSAIGDCLQLRDISGSGVLYSGFETGCVNISNWGLDEAITKQIATALSNRFTVKPVRYNRAGFTHVPYSPIPDSQPPVKKQLQALTNPGVDAYVVVTKLPTQGAIGESTQQLAGLGLGHESGIMFSGSTKMYAFYTIRIVDAHSFETLETEGAHLPKTGLFPRVPVEDVSNDVWARHPKDMTAAQLAQLRPLMTKMVSESIGSTLHYMDLAP